MVVLSLDDVVVLSLDDVVVGDVSKNVRFTIFGVTGCCFMERGLVGVAGIA